MSPWLAASIAPCIVGKSVGTVILAALAIGRGDNGITMRRIIAANINRPSIFVNDSIQLTIDNKSPWELCTDPKFLYFDSVNTLDNVIVS